MLKVDLWRTLKNGQVVKSNVYSGSQLCARFQIWAEKFGCSDSEGLAMFVADDRAKLFDYFGEEGERLAQSGFENIKGQNLPEYLPQGDSKICFEVWEISF